MATSINDPDAPIATIYSKDVNRVRFSQTGNVDDTTARVRGNSQPGCHSCIPSTVFTFCSENITVHNVVDASCAKNYLTSSSWPSNVFENHISVTSNNVITRSPATFNYMNTDDQRGISGDELSAEEDNVVIGSSGSDNSKHANIKEQAPTKLFSDAKNQINKLADAENAVKSSVAAVLDGNKKSTFRTTNYDLQRKKTSSNPIIQSVSPESSTQRKPPTARKNVYDKVEVRQFIEDKRTQRRFNERLRVKRAHEQRKLKEERLKALELTAASSMKAKCEIKKLVLAATDFDSGANVENVNSGAVVGSSTPAFQDPKLSHPGLHHSSLELTNQTNRNVSLVAPITTQSAYLLNTNTAVTFSVVGSKYYSGNSPVHPAVSKPHILNGLNLSPHREISSNQHLNNRLILEKSQATPIIIQPDVTQTKNSLNENAATLQINSYHEVNKQKSFENWTEKDFVPLTDEEINRMKFLVSIGNPFCAGDAEPTSISKAISLPFSQSTTTNMENKEVTHSQHAEQFPCLDSSFAICKVKSVQKPTGVRDDFVTVPCGIGNNGCLNSNNESFHFASNSTKYLSANKTNCTLHVTVPSTPPVKLSNAIMNTSKETELSPAIVPFHDDTVLAESLDNSVDKIRQKPNVKVSVSVGEMKMSALSDNYIFPSQRGLNLSYIPWKHLITGGMQNALLLQKVNRAATVIQANFRGYKVRKITRHLFGKNVFPLAILSKQLTVHSKFLRQTSRAELEYNLHNQFTHSRSLMQRSKASNKENFGPQASISARKFSTFNHEWNLLPRSPQTETNNQLVENFQENVLKSSANLLKIGEIKPLNEVKYRCTNVLVPDEAKPFVELLETGDLDEFVNSQGRLTQRVQSKSFARKLDSNVPVSLMRTTSYIDKISTAVGPSDDFISQCSVNSSAEAVEFVPLTPACTDTLLLNLEGKTQDKLQTLRSNQEKITTSSSQGTLSAQTSITSELFGSEATSLSSVQHSEKPRKSKTEKHVTQLKHKYQDIHKICESENDSSSTTSESNCQTKLRRFPKKNETNAFVSSIDSKYGFGLSPLQLKQMFDAELIRQDVIGNALQQVRDLERARELAHLENERLLLERSKAESRVESSGKGSNICAEQNQNILGTGNTRCKENECLDQPRKFGEPDYSHIKSSYSSLDQKRVILPDSFESCTNAFYSSNCRKKCGILDTLPSLYEKNSDHCKKLITNLRNEAERRRGRYLDAELEKERLVSRRLELRDGDNNADLHEPDLTKVELMAKENVEKLSREMYERTKAVLREVTEREKAFTERIAIATDAATQSIGSFADRNLQMSNALDLTCCNKEPLKDSGPSTSAVNKVTSKVVSNSVCIANGNTSAGPFNSEVRFLGASTAASTFCTGSSSSSLSPRGLISKSILNTSEHNLSELSNNFTRKLTKETDNSTIYSSEFESLTDSKSEHVNIEVGNKKGPFFASKLRKESHSFNTESSSPNFSNHAIETVADKNIIIEKNVPVYCDKISAASDTDGLERDSSILTENLEGPCNSTIHTEQLSQEDNSVINTEQGQLINNTVYESEISTAFNNQFAGSDDDVNETGVEIIPKMDEIEKKKTSVSERKKSSTDEANGSVRNFNQSYVAGQNCNKIDSACEKSSSKDCGRSFMSNFHSDSLLTVPNDIYEKVQRKIDESLAECIFKASRNNILADENTQVVSDLESCASAGSVQTSSEATSNSLSKNSATGAKGILSNTLALLKSLQDEEDLKYQHRKRLLHLQEQALIEECKQKLIQLQRDQNCNASMRKKKQRAALLQLREQRIHIKKVLEGLKGAARQSKLVLAEHRRLLSCSSFYVAALDIPEVTEHVLGACEVDDDQPSSINSGRYYNTAFKAKGFARGSANMSISPLMSKILDICGSISCTSSSEDLSSETTALLAGITPASAISNSPLSSARNLSPAPEQNHASTLGTPRISPHPTVAGSTVDSDETKDTVLELEASHDPNHEIGNSRQAMTFFPMRSSLSPRALGKQSLPSEQDSRRGNTAAPPFTKSLFLKHNLTGADNFSQAVKNTEFNKSLQNDVFEPVKSTENNQTLPPIAKTAIPRCSSGGESDDTLCDTAERLDTTQFETSETSDCEGRILALQEQLESRKREAETLRRERRRLKRERLASQEQALMKQIEAYDSYIRNARIDLDEEVRQQHLTPLVKPVIRKPTPRSRTQSRGPPEPRSGGEDTSVDTTMTGSNSSVLLDRSDLQHAAENEDVTVCYVEGVTRKDNAPSTQTPKNDVGEFVLTGESTGMSSASIKETFVACKETNFPDDVPLGNVVPIRAVSDLAECLQTDDMVFSQTYDTDGCETYISSVSLESSLNTGSITNRSTLSGVNEDTTGSSPTAFIKEKGDFVGAGAVKNEELGDNISECMITGQMSINNSSKSTVDDTNLFRVDCIGDGGNNSRCLDEKVGEDCTERHLQTIVSSAEPSAVIETPAADSVNDSLYCLPEELLAKKYFPTLNDVTLEPVWTTFCEEHGGKSIDDISDETNKSNQLCWLQPKAQDNDLDKCRSLEAEPLEQEDNEITELEEANDTIEFPGNEDEEAVKEHELLTNKISKWSGKAVNDDSLNVSASAISESILNGLLEEATKIAEEIVKRKRNSLCATPSIHDDSVPGFHDSSSVLHLSDLTSDLILAPEDDNNQAVATEDCTNKMSGQEVSKSSSLSPTESNSSSVSSDQSKTLSGVRGLLRAEFTASSKLSKRFSSRDSDSVKETGAVDPQVLSAKLLELLQCEDISLLAHATEDVLFWGEELLADEKNVNDTFRNDVTQSAAINDNTSSETGADVPVLSAEDVDAVISIIEDLPKKSENAIENKMLPSAVVDDAKEEAGDSKNSSDHLGPPPAYCAAATRGTGLVDPMFKDVHNSRSELERVRELQALELQYPGLVIREVPDRPPPPYTPPRNSLPEDSSVTPQLPSTDEFLPTHSSESSSLSGLPALSPSHGYSVISTAKLHELSRILDEAGAVDSKKQESNTEMPGTAECSIGDSPFIVNKDDGLRTCVAEQELSTPSSLGGDTPRRFSRIDVQRQLSSFQRHVVVATDQSTVTALAASALEATLYQWHVLALLPQLTVRPADFGDEIMLNAVKDANNTTNNRRIAIFSNKKSNNNNSLSSLNALKCSTDSPKPFSGISSRTEPYPVDTSNISWLNPSLTDNEPKSSHQEKIVRQSQKAFLGLVFDCVKQLTQLQYDLHAGAIIDTTEEGALSSLISAGSSSVVGELGRSLRSRCRPTAVIRRAASPSSVRCAVMKQVNVVFGFTTPLQRTPALLQWASKRRDHVDKILVAELAAEEASWTAYDTDEEDVKDKLAVEIFNDILAETVSLTITLLNRKLNYVKENV